MKIDLHGIKHEDVPRILIRCIEDNWGCDEFLEVITGHSPQMKKIVFKIASEYDLECEEGVKNSGYLLIII